MDLHIQYSMDNYVVIYYFIIKYNLIIHWLPIQFERCGASARGTAAAGAGVAALTINYNVNYFILLGIYLFDSSFKGFPPIRNSKCLGIDFDIFPVRILQVNLVREKLSAGILL